MTYRSWREKSFKKALFGDETTKPVVDDCIRTQSDHVHNYTYMY